MTRELQDSLLSTFWNILHQNAIQAANDVHASYVFYYEGRDLDDAQLECKLLTGYNVRKPISVRKIWKKRAFDKRGYHLFSQQALTFLGERIKEQDDRISELEKEAITKKDEYESLLAKMNRNWLTRFVCKVFRLN